MTISVQSLGKYKLVKEIGKGGMGSVWLSSHPKLDIPVAVKVLSDKLTESGEYIERFIEEGRTAAILNHPNIVRIFDADQDQGYHYLVMEYVDGLNIQQIASKQGNILDTETVIETAIKTSEALKEAQSAGIVHRDIKPENIMVTHDGKYKLADLGIAKRNTVDEGDSAYGMGTPSYISPEQALDARNVDLCSDIYSLGATMYHLLTGQVPFDDTCPKAIMMKHLQEPLVHPKNINPELPDNICAVVCKMMEKNPSSRYQSYEELLHDLKKIKYKNADVKDLSASMSFDTLVQIQSKDLKKKAERSRNNNPLLFSLLIIACLLTALLLIPQKKKESTTNTVNKQKESLKSKIIPGKEPGKALSIDLGEGVILDMVWIPAGKFMMGSPETETGRNNGERLHEVTISKGFWMGKYEVTVQQWQWINKKRKSENTSPVNSKEVSWLTAQSFIKKLKVKFPDYTFRLPTEAEWEYACRAGSETRFNTGEDVKNLHESGWYNGNRDGFAKKVGQKKPNSWGLYDMHGNALEWCSDWFGEYPDTPQVDPSGPEFGDVKVLRGGYWNSDARNCRSASRGRKRSDQTGYGIGFRLILDQPIKTIVKNPDKENAK